MNTNTHINMTTLSQLVKVAPGKTREFIKTIGRFHGFVMQHETYKARGSCYSSVSGNVYIDVYVDPEELETKVRMGENVSISSLYALNKLAYKNEFKPLLAGTNRMSRIQTAACILNFVEDIVRQSQYGEFMQELKAS